MWRRSGGIIILVFAFGTGILQGQYIPSEGLVSLWHFDETWGTVAYDWVGGNDGNLTMVTFMEGFGGRVCMPALLDSTGSPTMSKYRIAAAWT
jgi:hypothetical protein